MRDVIKAINSVPLGPVAVKDAALVAYAIKCMIANLGSNNKGTYGNAAHTKECECALCRSWIALDDAGINQPTDS